MSAVTLFRRLIAPGLRISLVLERDRPGDVVDTWGEEVTEVRALPSSSSLPAPAALRLVAGGRR
jgi:hypothetical protein